MAVKSMSDEIISCYEDIAVRQYKTKALTNLASAILLSAVEDGDVEFFESDFQKWKELKKQYYKETKSMTDIDFKNEFDAKEQIKECITAICGFHSERLKIPEEITERRNLFECYPIKEIAKKLGMTESTIESVAKNHHWKIGSKYVEPTIFDI